MSWYGYGSGSEVDITAYDRILEARHPRREGESRDEWFKRIEPERQAARVHKREPGRLARSANAVPAKGENDGT